MSGIISITSRRLPRNVLSLGMQAARSQEVKSANVVRQYARLATVQAQLFGESQNVVSASRPLGAMSTQSFHTSVSLWNLETIKVPPFADSVTEGDVKFTCKVGDYVKIDQNVMEIETDKTTVGVPAPFGGIIKEILVSDGDTVKAGQPLFKLEKAEGGAAPAAAPKAATPPPPPPPAAKPAAAAPPPAAKPAAAAPPPPKPAAPRPPPPPPAQPSASIPSASIPRAPGIVPPQVKVPPADYSRQITGTRTEQRVKMNRMRLKIAARLKEAQNVNAMLTTFNEIDMSGAMSFRKENLEAFQKKYGIKIGFMSIFTKAAAYALQDQPVVNAVIDGAEIVYRDYVDISVAVATPKGLVVPVIRNVEGMNYADIEIAMAALGDKARKGAIAVEDMDGGTFTISNGGVFGSLLGTPIINPPQSAILGMHGIFERPVAIKGQEIVYRDYVDISVAVATPKGLVVPVIRNVEGMNYADIEIAMAALGDKARKGAIAVEDMDGGTFTISNGGVFGSLLGTPIINPPQSAILGMHGIFERPVAIKGQVVVRPMMYVALTYDHRLIDGREAVLFLRKIKAAVEDPRIILAGL